MPDEKSKKPTGEQHKQFVEMARAIGCDESEAHFEEKLRQVARHKPPPGVPSEPKKPKTKKPAK